MSQSPQNPFAAPQVAADEHSAAAYPVLRLTISAMLLAAGVVFTLLMNGQTFTNNMGFLLLASTSGSLWLPLIAKSGYPHASLARWTVLVHAVIVLAIAGSLPAAYERQRKFNANMQKFRPTQGPLIDINPKR